MLVAIWGVLHVPPISKIFLLRTPRNKAAVALGITFLITGSWHFTSPELFDAMMPSYLPFPRRLIYFTGALEILGGAGMILPRTRRIAGIGLAILLVCIVPANIHVAMNNVSLTGMPDHVWYRWLRVGLQLIFIGWALVSSRRSYDR
jgi:uncharacterized membrane protein